MKRVEKPPSQTWRTFLTNHVGDIAACEFFVVPTATFRVLYVFFVLAHDRRHANSAGSPWQNSYAERMVGTFRRECLDHVIILNEAHLKRILTEFLDYYHGSRTHQSLGCNSPNPREVQPPERGEVISIPVLGGLHHRYARQAA